MNEKTRKTWGIPVLALLLLLAAAAVWMWMTYCLVEGTLYRRDTRALDLRGQQVSVSHYNALKDKLPEAVIRWDVPFQGKALSQETEALAVTALTLEEAALLAEQLPGLQKVDAAGCDDYESLALLKRLRPDMQVDYTVTLNGKNYAGTALKVTLENPDAEDINRLEYLPQLGIVEVTGGRQEILEGIQAYCKANGLALSCLIQGTSYTPEETVLEVTGITDLELTLLHLMPMLRQVYLREPEAAGESLTALREARTGLDLRWEKTVLGLTFSDDVQKVDLTEVMSLTQGEAPGTKTAYQYCADYPCQGDEEEERTSVKLLPQHPLPDKSAMTRSLIREVEAAMTYFPEAEKVVMVGCYLDNEQMDGFRTAREEAYEVVWTVQCGKVATRTDAKFFMPTKYHVYYFQDFETGNMKYLRDLVALDIGHMYIRDVSFVEYMPDLEYLILAHTDVRSIEPLRSLKKLKFLEVDWTPVPDLSPLEDCTALEDLNVGETWCSLEPLKEFTWLKSIWMIGRTHNSGLAEALPNTHVQVAGTCTVDMGWREKPNYYAMRDELKMFYMDW